MGDRIRFVEVRSDKEIKYNDNKTIAQKLRHYVPNGGERQT